MGIFSSYVKGFSDNMLGPQAPKSGEQDDGSNNRFMQAMGAAAANKHGGSRSEYKAPQMGLSEAFSKMNTGMNEQNAGGELDAMFADEASGATESSYKEPTAKERRDQQLQAMITSGNPQLMNAGLEIYSKDMEQPTVTPAKRSASWQKASDEGLTPGTPEHKARQQELNTPTKMFEGGGDKPFTVSERQKIVVSDAQGNPVKNVPSNLTPNMIEQQGWSYRTKQDALQTTGGNTVDALEMGLDTMYDAIENGKDATGMGTVLRNLEGPMGEAVNAGLNAAGIESSPEEIAFTGASNKMTGAIVKLMSGAAASDKERGFWETIQPRPTDTQAVKKQKYNQMIDFAASLAERAKKGGITGIPDFNKVKRFETKDGAKKGFETWSDEGYEYRRDTKTGKVQRRTI